MLSRVKLFWKHIGTSRNKAHHLVLVCRTGEWISFITLSASKAILLNNSLKSQSNFIQSIQLNNSLKSQSNFIQSIQLNNSLKSQSNFIQSIQLNNSLKSQSNFIQSIQLNNSLKSQSNFIQSIQLNNSLKSQSNFVPVCFSDLTLFWIKWLQCQLHGLLKQLLVINIDKW